MLAMIPRARARGAFFGLIGGMGTVAFVSIAAPEISFLWHNVIGAFAAVGIGMLLSLTDRSRGVTAQEAAGIR